MVTVMPIVSVDYTRITVLTVIAVKVVAIVRDSVAKYFR